MGDLFWCPECFRVWGALVPGASREAAGERRLRKEGEHEP